MANRFFDLRCPDCGGKITEEDERCPSCGADLNAPIEPSRSAQQFLTLAQEAYDKGRALGNALDLCDQAIEQQPDLAEAHNLRGLILDALGRPRDALLAYQEAVRLNPLLEDARANLEDAEKEIGPIEPSLSPLETLALAQKAYDQGRDLDNALDLCGQVIAQQPDLAEAHNLRGLILDALGRPRDALLAYQEAVRLDPAFEDARGNLDDAENEIGRIEPPPSPQEALALAQEAYERETDLWSALEYCDQAIQQQPDLAEAYNLRGLIFDALGKTEQAISSYREAVRLDPLLEDARANLEDAENERLKGSRAGVWQETKPELNWTGIILGIAGAALLLLCMALAYFLYPIGMQYLGPRQTVTFEPDYSSITSQVTQSDLQETANILTARAAQLGYPRVSFTVSENGEITAQIPRQLDPKDFSARISPIGLVEFVDFGETAILVGASVVTDFENNHPPQGQETPYHTLMTNSEIADVFVSTDSFGKPAVSFTFTEKGTRLFSEHTSRNIGKYLGIVRDKVVMSCPVINTPITDGRGIIQGQFTEQEARDLAAILQTKPLPFPIRIKQAAVSK